MVTTVADHFDQWAPRYDAEIRRQVPRYDEIHDSLVSLLSLRPPGQVLDLGVGTGYTTLRILDAFPEAQVTGIDASEEMLRMATRRCQHLIDAGRVRVALADSASIPYPDESFDKLVTVHTLYFWDDPRRHLRELHRVLRIGGRMVVGFHGKETAVAASFPASVYTFYGVDEVCALLRDVGFEEVVGIERSVGEVTLAIGHRRGVSL